MPERLLERFFEHRCLPGFDQFRLFAELGGKPLFDPRQDLANSGLRDVQLGGDALLRQTQLPELPRLPLVLSADLCWNPCHL